MNSKFWSIVGVAAGIVGLGYAIKSLDKINQIKDVVDRATNELSDNIHVDVSEALIERAVNKVASEQVSTMVVKATNEIKHTICADIRSKVDHAVSEAYSDIKKSVSEEISKQVGKVSIDGIRNEVIERAKEAAAEKFDEELDEILEKFNGDLNNVSKIYRSIANTFTRPENDKGFTFRLV